MNRFFAVLILLLLAQNAYCQEPTYYSQEPLADSLDALMDGHATDHETWKHHRPKNKIAIGYYGETLTHTGMVMGIEHYLNADAAHQMILAANVGGYVHRRNNTSLFLRGQWGQRITFRSGVFVEQFLGLGYLHHFANGGELYEVLPNGAVVNAPNSGRPMIKPSVAVGAGYHLKRITGWDAMFYLRPELFWKAPFNGYFLTHFALNTGFLFKIGGK